MCQMRPAARRIRERIRPRPSGDAGRTSGRRLTDTIVLRDRLAVGDRTFTVLADPWYDADGGEWKGRLLFVPLDRSLARSASSGPVKRSKRRNALLEMLRRLSDRDIARVFQSIRLPAVNAL